MYFCGASYLLVIQTLQAVSEREDYSQRAAFMSQASRCIQKVVQECEAQMAVAKPSPCEAIIRLKTELDSLHATANKVGISLHPDDK